MPEPVRGIAYEFYISLIDEDNSPDFKVNPTIATGDFKISKDGGTFANLTTLPVVTPAGSSSVKVNLSATEMDADKIVVEGKDAAGLQWVNISMFIDAPTGTGESVFDIIVGDIIESNENTKTFKRGTGTVLVEKDITGSLLQSGITITTLDPP